MGKLLGRFLPMGAALLAASLVNTAVPAGAAPPTTGAVAGIGSGTYSPGLTTTPTVQWATIMVNAQGGFVIETTDLWVEASASGSCTLDFTATATLISEQGHAMLMCTFTGSAVVYDPPVPTVAANANVTVTCDAVEYARAGVVYVFAGAALSCTITISSSAGTTWATAMPSGSFLMQPTNVSPTTSFQTEGALSFVGV
jgi:hypothetical protein